MGRNYLLSINLVYSVFCLLLSQNGPAESIQLPPTPRTILPPNQQQDVMRDDLARMKKRRTEREARENYVDWSAQLQKQLREEALKPRHAEFMTQVSMLYPFILTTGSRENYQADLTSHVLSLYRITHHKDPYIEHWWAGFRIAPFSGYGVQDKAPGRYGLYFFGPAFAWGTLGAPDLKSKIPTREGSLFSFGLSPAFTSGQKDDAITEDPSDFLDQRAPVIDIPALWFEYSDVTIHYGGLGMHWVLGAQLGSAKTFIWFGVATSGWI